MTIQSIRVKRKRFSVCHVRRSQANAAAKANGPLNIISIEYFEADRPEFDPTHNVLNLEDIDGMTEWSFDAVKKFVEECNGENIIVHCEMGMVRSKRIAKFITEQFPSYKITSLHAFANINVATIPYW